jgi:hypothetical protein
MRGAAAAESATRRSAGRQIRVRGRINGRVALSGCGDRSLADLKGSLAVKLVKRVAIILVIAFAVFYLVTRPEDAANAVQGATGAVWGAGVAITEFFGALVSG